MALLALAVATTAARGRAPSPFIVDADMDFDDVAAIAYLCQAHKQERIRLQAVTVANNGVGKPGAAIRHARCLLAACGLGEIPVADNGARRGPNHTSVILQAFAGRVVASAFSGCSESSDSSAISADALMAQTLTGAEPVRVLMLGPMTNLATAIGETPALVANIEHVYAMAGAIHVDGELAGEHRFTHDGSQTLNSWIDPAALDLLLKSLPGKLTLIPQDATDHVPMSTAFAGRLRAAARTPEGRLVSAIADHVLVRMATAIGLPPSWWDPLAALAATDVPVVHYADVRIRVILAGRQTGRTEPVATGGTQVRAALSADRPLFEERFLEALNAPRPTRP